MAHAKTPFPISGTLGQFVFFHQDGKQYLRTRPEFNREKWNKPYSLPRRAAEAFGGAQICASRIHSSLKEAFKSGGMLPYAHNHIAGKLRGLAYSRHGITDAYTSRHIASALHRLDIGAGKSTARAVSSTLLGPNHDPHTVVLKGIHQAAQAIDPSGQLNLQFQVKVFHLAIQPYQKDQESRKWQPVHSTHANGSLLMAEPRTTLWHSVKNSPDNHRDSHSLSNSHSLSPDNHRDPHSHSLSPDNHRDSQDILRIPLNAPLPPKTKPHAPLSEPDSSKRTWQGEKVISNLYGGKNEDYMQNASQPEPEGIITFISIQFRTASRSRRPAVLHDHTFLRCVSIHMSEEQAASHAIHNTKPRRNYRPRRVCQPSARSRVTSSIRRKTTPQPPAPRQAGGPRSAIRWASPQLE